MLACRPQSSAKAKRMFGRFGSAAWAGRPVIQNARATSINRGIIIVVSFGLKACGLLANDLIILSEPEASATECPVADASGSDRTSATCPLAPLGGEVDDDLERTLLAVAEDFKGALNVAQGEPVREDRRNVHAPLADPL